MMTWRKKQKGVLWLLCSLLAFTLVFTLVAPVALAADGVIITGIAPTPYVRTDGLQETTLSVSNSGTAFAAWAKVTVGNQPAVTVQVGNIGAGSSQATLLVPDTNSLLSPGETTTLNVELYDNANCTGSAVATYTDKAWARTRHWEFYLSQEMHTDLGYTAYQEDLKESYSGYLDTVKEYMENSDNRATDAQKYKYGIESGFMLGEAYMARRNADEIGELLELIDAERMTVYAGQFNYTMENFGAEETARAAYYTNRYLVDALGIEQSSTINMFDNPSFSKSFVDIANSAGIKYGVHSMNASRSPYHQVREYDLYYMQGYDPANKLLIFNGRGYSENYGFGGSHFDLSYAGVDAAKESIFSLINDLESRSGRRAYPYDKFLMALVPYGDNQRPMEDQIITANALNKELSDAGYAYPRVTVAFSDDFFEAIEREYADLIPVESGTEENWWNDGWGTTAYESGINKQAANRLPVAETLSAFATLFAGANYPYNDLAEGYQRLLTYDEHTWGSAGYDATGWQYNNQFEWKRSNALGASALADRLAGNALDALAGTVKTEGQAIYVYNQLNWVRNDVVTVSDLSALPEHFVIMDGEKSVAYTIADGVLTFVAEDVPAIGYKVFDIVAAREQPAFTSSVKTGENTIENEYYKVTFAADGTVSSIIDRQNGNRELVDASAEEKFNQYRYYDDHGIPFATQWADFSEENWDLYTPLEEVSTLRVDKTAIGATAALDTSTFRAGSIRQKVTLYDGIPRIDIENVVVKDALDSLQAKEEAFYTFPFATGEDYEIRYDLPVGNAAEGEQVYGTATDWYTVNKWISVTDEADGYNMVLATPDTGLAQFGERRTGQWSFDYHSEHPYIYSYVMNNQWETNFQGDQPGQVTFNYSISTNLSGVGDTAKFGWEISSPLEATVIASAQSGNEKTADSLIEIDNENVILTTMKTAEANSDGMILRLHEVAGSDAESVTVTLPFTVDSVYATDIIENDEKQIAGAGNTFTIDLPAYQMRTLRLRFGAAPAQVTGVTATTHQAGESVNLSETATATASSTYSGEYSADNAKDGGDGLDWASAGEVNAWYQLTWDQPVTVGSIRLFDRPNTTDNIQSVKLIFDDGSSVNVDNIATNGSVKEVVLDAPKTTAYIKAEITGMAGTWNVGLSGLEVYAGTASHIDGTMVGWESVENALYYEVFRSTDRNFTTGSGSYLGVSDCTEYFDAQVNSQVSKTYYYRVRAVAAGAKGVASAAVSPAAGVVTDGDAPDAPALYADARDGDRIDLYWTPVTDNVALSHYDIYRDGVKIGETNDAYVCTYRDTGLQSAVAYEYTVKAVDLNGKTAASNVVTAATLDTVTATLDGLLPSNGLLSPGFDPGITDYTLNLGDVPISGIQLTPLGDTDLRLEIDGQPVEVGKPSQRITIETGRVITLRVEEGETVRYYTLRVTDDAPVIRPVSATAGDEYDPAAGGQAPHKVIDGNGMTGAGIGGKHDANGSAFSMWHTDANPGEKAWLQVDLGQVYTLDELYIWNMNQHGNTDRGMKNVKIQYSEDGVNWVDLAPEEGMTFQDGNVDYPFQLAAAGGENGQKATNLNDGKNTPVRFGGVAGRYVKITAAPTPGDGSWGDVYYGLSEVRVTALLTAEDVIPVESITVTAEKNTVTQAGGSLQMQAAVMPENATKPDVVWRVVDEKGDDSPAAVISADGLFTARANGTITVIATATDGSRVQGKMQVIITGQPAVITGVTATSGNDYDATRSAMRTVDGSGMSGTASVWDTHDDHNHAETMWHTDANPGDTAWIEFDLGEVKRVGEMYVWNMNQGGGADRGLKEIKIEYKTDADGQWTELRGADAGEGEYPYTLAPSAGGAQMSATNLVGGKPVQFGVEARYIRITAGSSYGSTYWGLSEVRFTEGVEADPPPVDPPVEVLQGDVDASGKVDVADIMKLKALIMADKWSEAELSVGDMDGSGKLDVGDIMAIKNIIMSA